jgi:insulysin
MEKDIES